LKFFIDNNLSQQLAVGMRGFGEHVIHLKDKFSPDTDDPIWLKFIGENGLILVTRDERIRWRPAELRALKDHKVGAFFLGGKNRTRCQLIQQLVRSWPRMKDLAGKTKTPFVFRVPPQGTKVTQIPLS